jgi:hypothetical protein
VQAGGIVRPSIADANKASNFGASQIRDEFDDLVGVRSFCDKQFQRRNRFET